MPYSMIGGERETSGMTGKLRLLRKGIVELYEGFQYIGSG